MTQLIKPKAINFNELVKVNSLRFNQLCHIVILIKILQYDTID